GGGAAGGGVGRGAGGWRGFAGRGGGGAPQEGGPPLSCFLPPPPHVPARGPNRHDQQNGGGDGVIAVALPQLLELFSPNFLVDFLKDVGHGPPNPVSPPPATRQLAD